jgi:hypothetical protein
MRAYLQTAVLMIALAFAPAAPAAGKGSAASASSSSAIAASARSAGRATPGGTPVTAGGAPAAARGGSASGTGSGMYRNRRAAPELDPGRKISEQDCTKPIAFDAGNLRCK